MVNVNFDFVVRDLSSICSRELTLIWRSLQTLILLFETCAADGEREGSVERHTVRTLDYMRADIILDPQKQVLCGTSIGAFEKKDTHKSKCCVGKHWSFLKEKCPQKQVMCGKALDLF